MGVLSRVVVALLLAMAVAGCVHGDRNSAAREEYKARPACAGIVDAAVWTECMERFKDIRPQHSPTELQFKDWRT
jgi:hypothetical protein